MLYNIICNIKIHLFKFVISTCSRRYDHKKCDWIAVVAFTAYKTKLQNTKSSEFVWDIVARKKMLMSI